MKSQALAIVVAVALLSTILSANAQGVTAEIGEPFELMFGQEASIDPEGIVIKFDSFIEDSRCPADVVCIQQGQATIGVSVKVGGADAGLQALTIGADESKSVATFGQYSVKLTDLQPYPISTVQIDIEDYVATLVVSRAPANSTGVFVKAVGDVAAISGWNLEREKGTLVILDNDKRTVVRFVPSAAECISAGARECIDGQVTDATGSGPGDTIHLEVAGDRLFIATGDAEYTLDIRQIRTRT